MKLQVQARSEVGHRRRVNEDCVVIGGSVLQAAHGSLATSNLEVPTMISVLDGMGGMGDGGLASRIAADVLVEYAASLGREPGSGPGLADPERATADVAQTRGDPTVAYHEANCRIVGRMDVDGTRGMGTTAVTLVAGQSELEVVNVGDATAFRLDGDFLIELSVADRAPTGAVTGSLGGTSELVDVSPHRRVVGGVRVGDRFLLCTDGLTDVVGIERIEERLADRERSAVDGLVADVLTAGAPDNVTVVMVEVVGGPP